jgi:cholesterol transport system auxiliary component
MKLAHILFSCACAVFLSSCFSAGAKNTVVYTPRTSSPAANSAPAVAWHLRIDTPKSSVFLDSTHIAVRRENNILQIFEGARWADSAPDLLHNNLMQYFNNSGKITTIAGLDNNTASDALLLLDIQQFEAVYTDKDRSASAVISVQANIQLQKTNRIIASKHFLVSIPAENKKIPAVMNAFDNALEQLSQDILSWTLTADVTAKK